MSDQIINPNPNSEGATPPAEEPSGLKKALEAERAARRDIEKQLKELLKSDEERKAAAVTAQAEAKGDYEKLKQALESEKVKLTKEKEEAVSGFHTYLVKSEATAAIAAAKGVPALLLPIVMDKLEAVKDGETYRVLVKGTGQPVADYLETLKADAAYGRAFEASGVSGSGAPPAGKGTPGKSMPLIAFNALSPKDRASFMASGGTLKE